MSRLIPIQVLRAIAALAVAVLHAQYEAGLLAEAGGATFRPSRLLPWEAGVDVFFVISGFVMVFASRRLFAEPGARAVFLIRRIARVVPLYWLTTSVYLALALAAPALVNGTPTPGYVLASYLFVPAARPDGTVQPLYSLGWTLDYEMFFYLLFAIALSLRARAAVMAVLVALGLLVAMVGVVNSPVPLAFWGDPIVLEFGVGMLLGLARIEGVVLGATARVVLGLIGVGLFGLVAQVDPHLPRVMAFGVPAGFLVAACGLGRAHKLAEESWPVRAGTILGDSSYALYLIHPFVIRGMRQALQHLAPTLPEAPSLLVILGLIAAFAASVLVFRWVERPLTRLVRAGLERRPIVAEP